MPWKYNGDVFTNSTGTVKFYRSSGEGYSYGTKIARRIDGIVYIDTHFFSVTTSKHRNIIRNAAALAGYYVILVDAKGNIDSFIPFKGIQEELF